VLCKLLQSCEVEAVCEVSRLQVNKVILNHTVIDFLLSALGSVYQVQGGVVLQCGLPARALEAWAQAGVQEGGLKHSAH
jgi:hypothetical protein